MEQDTTLKITARFEYVMVDIDVMDDERLTPIEKVTFVQLRRFANLQTSQCYPSVKTLAKVVNCSERAVQYALKKLTELGLIVRRECFDKGKKRQTTSEYTIIGHRAECYQEGCRECTGGGAPVAHRTITSNEYNNTLTRGADLPSSCETENAEEKFTPDDAPEIMRPTARYFLQRTGREFLRAGEIAGLKALTQTQYPTRVQKEIDKVCERYISQNRPLNSLHFEYIETVLRHQPSRRKKGTKDKETLAVEQSWVDEMSAFIDAQNKTDFVSDEDIAAEIERLQKLVNSGGIAQ